MKYLLFLFPIFLQAQCLIPTHSYRLICADEVRYADSISSGSRLYISSRNAFVTSPRSVFSLVNGYGQHFIQITNSANSQKVAINRAWINRIDSTSSNKALIYIKDISVTFTTTESYTAVKDSAIACFVRAVSSGLATLSDGDYGDVVVSGGGLVMTVDKPDLGLHNLADGDFSVVADSTALSLTGTRAITLQTQNIDGWISRYLQTHNSLTLRANNTTKTSRIFVDTTGANFQFVNGANNASLRIGDSVAVRFNTSGSVGQVLTVTSIDGDGRLVINPKTGGSGTANCEQTLTKNSHGFRKWTPIYWNGSAWARPTFDSIIPTYIVVDSTSVNTFKVSNCGNYSSTLTAGLYYYKGASPGYSLTPTSIPTPLFEVAQARLILQPLVGFNLAGGSGSGTGITDGDKGEITVTDDGATWTIDNGVISNAKLATNAVDSTKAANLALSDMNTSSGSVGQVPTITASGLKYRTPTSAGVSPTDTLFYVKIDASTTPINLKDTLNFSSSGGGSSLIDSVRTSQSVTGSGRSTNTVRLVNDETTPGNNRYYGTGLSGTRGWYPNIFTESNQNLKTKTGIRSLTLGPADSLSANQFVITSRSDLAQRMGMQVTGDTWYIRNNANSAVAHFGSASRIYGTLQIDGGLTLNSTLTSNASFTILPTTAGGTVNNFFGNGSSAASSNSALYSRCQSSSGFARFVLQKTSGTHEVHFTVDASNNFVISRVLEGNLLTNAVGSNIIAFSSTNGFIFPVGNSAQKSGSPAQGETRFTSTIKATEQHDGDRWWVGDRQENGSVSTSTNGSGAITVTTGTFINTTYTAFVQVTGATPYVTTVTSKTTTGFTVNFFDMAGAAVASTAVTFDWRISKN